MRQLKRDGRDYAVVPHGTQETKILRNLGFDTPSPILSQYDWCGDTPWDSQRERAARMTVAGRFYDLSDMGTGKTRTCLYAYDFLKREGLVSKMLVVAPLSTLVSVWDREIFTTYKTMRGAVLHGTKERRLKILAATEKFEQDIHIINHDGVKVLLPELMRQRYDVVVLDEMSFYRNPSTTNRWKPMNQLVNGIPAVRWVWGLTGGPTPNEPVDAYGQAKLVTPHTVPRSRGAFWHMTMYRVTQFKAVPKHDANDVVSRALQPSIRYTLDECHDIPEQIPSFRTVEMTPRQRTAYVKMMKDCALSYKGATITAVNEAALLTKLRQISLGFAYDDNQKPVYLGAAHQFRTIYEVIAEARKKVLVFSAFKWACQMLKVVIGKKYSVEMITGDTPRTERDRIIAGFRGGPDPHVIVAHPGTMAHGLTLVEADTIIWYGPTDSNEQYLQANARVRRPGQKLHTNVVHIYASPVEYKAFVRLQKKQRMQGLLLSILQEEQEEPM